ncbi:MAG: ATP-binding protein [Candidatus Omnitrophica bacterium]|nr:ATP-binding protein [Candidatus Omnitrophota bacterium]
MATAGKLSESFLNRVIEEAGVLLIYLNREGKITFCNKKVFTLTGRAESDLLGEPWTKLLYCHSNTQMKQQMFKAVMDDAIAYKRANAFEGLISGCDEKEHLISWCITPIIAKDSVLEGVLLVGNDITGLKEKESSLKNIDGTLRNIMSSIKEYALFAINLDGNITYFGMGSEYLFGWRKDEIVFKDVRMLFTEGDTDVGWMLSEVKLKGRYETEAELKKKDNTLFPVDLTVTQLKDTDNNLIGYILIAKDVTAMKKLEYEVFQSEKLAAIGQLAAGMAHEINNPLFVISGRLELLKDNSTIGDDVREGLGIINSQAERIRKLVDRLLKFARKSVVHLEEVSINEVIESVIPLISYHKNPDSNVIIERHLAQVLPAIKGDLNQLQEVFVNLLLNAYQSMPQGGTLNITSEAADGNSVLVKISDTGVGIKQNNLKNIFMPFYSTKSDGTGLGLSICYNIIKNHNGSIEIESVENKGTTFTIKLPFA